MLNKHINSLVLSENYLLFKHFLRTFNLSTERLKRAEIPAKVSIPRLISDNIRIERSQSTQQDLKPYIFFTDGGTYNDDIKYFVHNIFSTSGVCYSTKIPTNANL